MFDLELEYDCDDLIDDTLDDNYDDLDMYSVYSEDIPIEQYLKQDTKTLDRQMTCVYSEEVIGRRKRRRYRDQIIHQETMQNIHRAQDQIVTSQIHQYPQTLEKVLSKTYNDASKIIKTFLGDAPDYKLYMSLLLGKN